MKGNKEAHDIDNYFDLFHGGQHLLSEMGVATEAARSLVTKGDIQGQYCFIPQENGTVVFDMQLSIAKEVKRRKIREELRTSIKQIHDFSPLGQEQK